MCDSEEKTDLPRGVVRPMPLYMTVDERRADFKSALGTCGVGLQYHVPDILYHLIFTLLGLCVS